MDDALIQLAKGGSRDAQAKILRAMQDDWYRFCLSQLGGAGARGGGDVHAAEDATQETALRVLRSLGHFDGRSSFKTWSFGVALNVCREIRRRKANARKRGTDSTGGDDFDFDDVAQQRDAAEPISIAGLAEQTDALRKAMTLLPERQREVVTLRYLESLSVAETAQMMGCAAGTVKAALFAALRTMRKHLGGHEDEPTALPGANRKAREMPD